eukprot:gene8043-5596_t
MTTMAKVDETLQRFNRKSPRDAYKQVCEELGVHCQRQVYNKLPDVANAWHRVQSLELDNILLGSKGCMAILPCIVVSSTLRKISLRGCGVSDDFVKELCETLQGHPTVRYVDISDNELVTIYSASSIISLMKNNSNMTNFDVDGTHVGDNVGNIIAGLGEHNRVRVRSYYVDNYFKLKDLFGYLDENGEGWVLLKSLVMNCPYPVLQEQFAERISTTNPKKRSDNMIDINTFMQLVYMNYKTEGEVLEHSDKPFDVPYVFMVANWQQVMAAAERYNEANENKVTLPDDFHRLRVKDFLLTNEEADSIISAAVVFREEAIEKNEHQEGGDKYALDARSLIKASRSSFSHPDNIRPVYQFYQERDAAYIPDTMRNGSRLFSINSMPMGKSNNSSISSHPDENKEKAPLSAGDLPHTWRLPSSIVKDVVAFFKAEHTKVPKKKQSVVAESPRALRDKAMEKPAIPIQIVLNKMFESEYEKINCALLRDYFSRYSLPIEDCSISMQEIANVLDELYMELSIDKAVSKEAIKALDNPLKNPKYAEFLQKHLLDRDEDVRIVEALRESVTKKQNKNKTTTTNFFFFFAFALFFSDTDDRSLWQEAPLSYRNGPYHTNHLVDTHSDNDTPPPSGTAPALPSSFHLPFFFDFPFYFYVEASYAPVVRRTGEEHMKRKYTQIKQQQQKSAAYRSRKRWRGRERPPRPAHFCAVRVWYAERAAPSPLQVETRPPPIYVLPAIQIRLLLSLSPLFLL